VLLVAGDVRVRDGLTRAMREMGFEVRSTGLPENALRLLERETHDIIVVDLDAPGMGGLPFLERVRTGWPDVQTIVLSRQIESNDPIRRAQQLDGARVLGKPCSLGELEVALDAARRRRMQVVPSAAEPSLPEPPEDVSPSTITAADTRTSMSLEELERRHILATLEKNHGNRTHTAAELGISLRKLYYRLGQYQREGLLQKR
jgi:DNA-binding NtrC family response regulator